MSPSPWRPVTPDLTPSPYDPISSNPSVLLPPRFPTNGQRTLYSSTRLTGSSHTAGFRNGVSRIGSSTRNVPWDFSRPWTSSVEGPATRNGQSNSERSLLPPVVPMTAAREDAAIRNGSSPNVHISRNHSVHYMGLSRPSSPPPRAAARQRRQPRHERQLITKPKVVNRPEPSLADNPGAAMVRMSEQAYKDQIPADCQPFSVTPLEFLHRHPFFDHVFAHAAVFTHFARPPLARTNGSSSSKNPYLEPRLLMMQRAANHSDRPGCWELPGGTVQRHEESIFHGLAREIWSLTNLNISYIVRKIEKGIVFTSDYQPRDDVTQHEENWLKVFFEVQCKEIQEMSTYQGFVNGENFHDFIDRIPVRMSRAHQAWSWMTKEGVKLMLDGKVDAGFVSSEHGRMALRAFELRENQGTRSNGVKNGPKLGKRRREVEENGNGDRHNQ
ncbi:MAG: hypothetical protein LQ338_001168 [Usnochroma carphineum]|nr:MAG: hypothetical protein LQ338_001168 [Usnochroma carphineum]